MLEKSFIIAFLVFGIHYIIYTPGMIFYFIREIFFRGEIRDRHWIAKPLYTCPICMTVWYGTLVYWLVWHTDWREWLVCIFTAMGINAVIVWVNLHKG